MKKIQLGIVGLKRGSSYVYGYKTMPDVEIKAVCETDKDTVEAMRKDIPEETLFFDDFNAFIDCGLDAVVLANYFHEHAKYAIIALNKGIHVFSETTAAPTLGECVQLCEAVEKSGCKYMLTTNTPFFNGCRELDRLYKGNTFGRVLYAEAEYVHPTDPREKDNPLLRGEYHWRRFLPRTYYNMHDLGTLMRMTELLPKRVNARAVFAPDALESPNYVKNSGDVSAVILTEMESGAIFRTTSCAALSPMGKWFRLSCINGSIETIRGDQDSVQYEYSEWAVPEGGKLKDSYKADEAKLTEEQKKSGHGGTDYGIYREFIEYLLGNTTPFFDVYASVALSAAAIYAWRSVLDNGACYEIPDFRDKEARQKVANDFLTPFPQADGSGITLPCSSKPYQNPNK